MAKKKSVPQTMSRTADWPAMQSFQTELNRVIDRFHATPFGADPQVMPVLDVAETEDAVEITAEMPGVKPEDLEVSVSDRTLTLKGRKSGEREDRGKDWHHVERSFGRFRRQVNLGFAPGDGKIDATFKDGILTLRIAKPAEAVTSARRIDITST